MDRTVPKGAALLLVFIYETKKKVPAGYDVVFGNRQSALAKPLTSMTIAEVQDGQKMWKTLAWAHRFGSKKASSAAGAPQFMEDTLTELIKELKLRAGPVFNGNLQDRLAYHLLKRHGYDAYMAGEMSRTEFGKRLAQEWCRKHLARHLSALCGWRAGQR